MNLVNKAPKLVADLDPVPRYVEVAYAMYAIRTLIGAGRYEEIENEVVKRIYIEDIAALGRRILMLNESETTPFDKNRFFKIVSTIRLFLTSDGCIKLLDKRGVSERVKNPKKIARFLAELSPDITESHVKVAQREMKVIA